MILGLEDIPGATPLAAFFIWLALSGLFYLVCYLAVLNVLDDLTRNSLIKVPAEAMVAPSMAGTFIRLLRVRSSRTFSTAR